MYATRQMLSRSGWNSPSWRLESPLILCTASMETKLRYQISIRYCNNTESRDMLRLNMFNIFAP